MPGAGRPSPEEAELHKPAQLGGRRGYSPSWGLERAREGVNNVLKGRRGLRLEALIFYESVRLTPHHIEAHVLRLKP